MLEFINKIDAVLMTAKVLFVQWIYVNCVFFVSVFSVFVLLVLNLSVMKCIFYLIII